MVPFFISITMSLLREYIKNILSESAIRDMSGLGLYIKHSGSQIDFTLYDAATFISETKANRKLTFYPDMIKGVIKAKESGEYGNCHGAWEVAAVVADKGYGPTMYDIAMSMVPSKTLMPDRGSVSSAAADVWSYYKNKRGDVQALKMDTDPKSSSEYADASKPIIDLDEGTSSKGDDCFSTHFDPKKDFLNYAYKLVGEPIDIAEPVKNHMQIVQGLDSLKEGLGVRFEDILSKGFSQVFGLGSVVA